MGDDIFAFPSNEQNDEGRHFYSHLGMTLRDWFAGQIASGFVAGHRTDTAWTPEYAEVADYSYKMADALLARRERQN